MILNKRLFFLFIMLFILGGCASKVVLVPKYCKNDEAKFDTGVERDFHFKIRKWSFFDLKNLEVIDIEKVLKSKNIQCSECTL